MVTKKRGRRLKVGNTTYNYNADGKRVSTTTKYGKNVTKTSFTDQRTPKITTDLGGGYYDVIGGKKARKPKAQRSVKGSKVSDSGCVIPAIFIFGVLFGAGALTVSCLFL